MNLKEPERRVLELLAEGFRDQEIADKLHYGRNYVSNVVWRACDLLGARTRAHAVALYERSKK